METSLTLKFKKVLEYPMAIKPHYLGASIPDALQDPAINKTKTVVFLTLSYRLSEVGYPGNSEDSMTALHNRLKDYSVQYLNGTPLGIDFKGSITDVYIAQDAAWIAVAVLFQANKERVTQKLQESGYQIGDCGSHYSRQSFSVSVST